MLSSYFITGTGRCGTLVLAKALDFSKHTLCNHEYSIQTAKLKKSFFKNQPALLIKDIDRLLAPTIEECNKKGRSYGECSGHLYPLFPELFRRYEYSARFILLIREPASFIRSALARGFFSPEHPNGLEHGVPPKDTEMGRRWSEASSLEKCAWYWGAVNGMVIRFFMSVPSSLYRIVPIETLSISVVKELYDFLMLEDFEGARPEIEKLLAERHNASPGQGDERFLNPYSQAIKLGSVEEWSKEQRSAFEKHVRPIRELIYSELKESLFRENLSFIRGQSED